MGFLGGLLGNIAGPLANLIPFKKGGAVRRRVGRKPGPKPKRSTTTTRRRVVRRKRK